MIVFGYFSIESWPCEEGRKKEVSLQLLRLAAWRPFPDRGASGWSRAHRSRCSEEPDPSEGRSRPLELTGQGIEGGFREGASARDTQRGDSGTSAEHWSTYMWQERIWGERTRQEQLSISQWDSHRAGRRSCSHPPEEKDPLVESSEGGASLSRPTSAEGLKKPRTKGCSRLIIRG